MKLCTSNKVLLVLDEADYSLLDIPSDFKNTPKSKFKAVIAISASLPVNDLYDMRTLKNLGFDVFDTKISGALNEGMAKPRDLSAFFNANPERAKLIYTSEDRQKDIL